MPTGLLKSYAKEANVSIEKAEKCWERSKDKADMMLKDKPKDPAYWAMVNSETRVCLHLPKSKPKKETKK